MASTLLINLVSSIPPGQAGRITLAVQNSSGSLYEYYWLISNPFGMSPRDVGSFLDSIKGQVAALTNNLMRFEEAFFQSSGDGGLGAINFLRSASRIAAQDFNRFVLSPFIDRNAVAINASESVMRSHSGALLIIQNNFSPARIRIRQPD